MFKIQQRQHAAAKLGDESSRVLGAEVKIVDLGVDVGADKIIAAVREHQANLVAMSALLTTTMVNMKGVVEALSAAGLREKVKIMVGGAPVTDAWARSIGADGYGKMLPRPWSWRGSL